MGKKSKRHVKHNEVPPLNAAARAAGIAVNASRESTLVRLIETAVWLWFLDADPFVVHFVASGVYWCLTDLSEDEDSKPRMGQEIGKFKMTAAYDFMKHPSLGMIDDSVDLAPMTNSWLLFESIVSFEKLYGRRSAIMTTFLAWYAVRRVREGSTVFRQNIEAFLPDGIQIEDVLNLSRPEFLAKLAPDVPWDSPPRPDTT